jgi:hypothetical protein
MRTNGDTARGYRGYSTDTHFARPFERIYLQFTARPRHPAIPCCHLAISPARPMLPTTAIYPPHLARLFDRAARLTRTSSDLSNINLSNSRRHCSTISDAYLPRPAAPTPATEAVPSVRPQELPPLQRTGERHPCLSSRSPAAPCALPATGILARYPWATHTSLDHARGVSVYLYLAEPSRCNHTRWWDLLVGAPVPDRPALLPQPCQLPPCHRLSS